MAQEVKLLGATYSDVPSIEVPDSNGTFHPFTDVSNTTAVASDVADGKYFYNSSGTRTRGTASASAEEPTVFFYDYDGTVLLSYTAEQALALTSMPSCSTYHQYLNSSGWNYTLAEMKTEVTEQGKCNIGQLYTTDDGVTRIHCDFPEGCMNPLLGLAVNGTIRIDWGDGSGSNTLTGTSLTSLQTIAHDYGWNGDMGWYGAMISITVVSGSFAFYGTSNSVSMLLRKGNNTTANINTKYASAVKSIELGSNVVIGNYAFACLKNLKTISIPSSITSTGDYAFRDCYSLKAVVFPSGVTSIGNYAFYNDYSLETVVSSPTTGSIGNYAFTNCYAMNGFVIPYTVTSIGINAFSSCYSLQRIRIPSGLTTLGNYTFQNCYALKDVTIPYGVTSIGNYVFYACRSITTLEIPDSVTSLGSHAFYACYSLSFIRLSENITEIKNNTFTTCYALENIDIPYGVTSIGNYVFDRCTSLQKVQLGYSMTTIGNNAFKGCQSMSAFYSFGELTLIDRSAFEGCYGMQSYYFYQNSVPRLNTGAFTNIQSDVVIYVAPFWVDEYKSASNWSTYANYIQAYDEGE